MLKKVNFKFIILLVMMAVMAVGLFACTPASEADNYPYSIVDNDLNRANQDNTTKDEAVKRTSDSITNLKTYLKSTTVSDTGYYMEFDFDIDTDTGDNFELKFRGNLYTYPYEIKDDTGNVIGEDAEAKAIHNEVIKKSDLFIEWYNGHTNELMIGFYFDGKNATRENPGNNLYLNLRGYKRWYRDFGNTVLFQQIMRLITNIDIEMILADNDSSIDSGINKFASYLSLAVTNNYKLTKNDDTTSIFYENIALDLISTDITSAIRAVFSPFEDKIDPLTNKYLGFKFSTMGQVQIQTLNADLRFMIEPDVSDTQEVLYGVDANMDGTALSYGLSVPYRANAYLRYSTRVSSEIVFDFDGYDQKAEFKHGQYEFNAKLQIPSFGLEYDGEVLTSLNEVDNTTNKIDARFRNLGTQNYALMMFYRDELAYINTEGIEDIYGAIQLKDLNFPKVYYDGINMADLMKWFYDTVNQGFVSIVDTLLDPTTYQNGGVDDSLLKSVMAKVRSHGDQITLTVDVELIKDVLRYTQEVDPNADPNGYYTLDDKGRPLYTTAGLVKVLSDFIGYDLEQIAAIFGVASAEILLEKTWFDVTYDVETNYIYIELFTSIRRDNSTVFKLTLIPVRIGQDITFPTDFNSFTGYKPLKEVQTLSSTINGTIAFNSADEVDLSKLLGAMISDSSGLNTVYKTGTNASINFTLVFDQYIQYSEDDENLNYILNELENNGIEIDYASMAGEMRGRMAFYLTMRVSSNRGEDVIMKVYAYNVAFNQSTYDKIEAGETGTEGYGYVYVDLTGGTNPALTSIPMVKIREDIFMQSFYDYIGKTDAANSASTLSIYSIISALMEDSTFYTTDTAISITTSNRTLQRLFGIDDLVANFQVTVGFKSRVKGSYSVVPILDKFADYTVGSLENLEVLGVYDGTVPIHDTIQVVFRWMSGDNQVKNLFFKYYKETQPERGDYPVGDRGQEEYDSAVASYEAYLVSKNNIDIDGRKRVYYPKIDGKFMGAEREYVLTINNPGNQSNAVAKIDSLVTSVFSWEPLEAKPTQIAAINSNNASTMNYSANFLLDWSTVTIDGLPAAVYTVIIGENSLGEFTAPVTVSVKNRRVADEDGNIAAVVYVYTDDGEVAAPVVGSFYLDPYDYILNRYGSAYRNLDGTYISPYLATRALTTLRFMDGTMEESYYSWSFDVAPGNNLETAINERGGTIYVHTVFHNQVLALRLNILERKVSKIVFSGEADNTYTVDVLDETTRVLPTRPTVYFEQGVPIVFSFDLVWSESVANNVSINGAAIVDGVPSPFLNYEGNVVTAYLDIARAFGIGNWFGKQILRLTVEVPPKVISELYDATVETAVTGGATDTVSAVSIGVVGTRENGYWFVDPRYESTLVLPSDVVAYFEDGTSKGYAVQWNYAESDLVTYSNGVYRFNNDLLTGDSLRLFKLSANLGGVYDFNLVVVRLPYTYSGISAFYGEEDASASLSGTGATYTYRVNPYGEVFKLPNRIRFDYALPLVIGAKNSTDHTFSNTYDIIPIQNGLVYTYPYGENSGHGEVSLTVASDGKTATGVTFENPAVSSGATVELTVLGQAAPLKITVADVATKTMLIEGMNLSADGYITVEGVRYSARQLIHYLLTRVTIAYDDAGVPGSTLYDAPEIVNFDKVYNSQNLGKATGQQLTLRLSVVPGILDYSVTVKGSVQKVITEVKNTEITIQQFAADAQHSERYPNGYSLLTHKLNVVYDDLSLAEFTCDWYVDSFSDEIKGLTIGQFITSISREILLAKYTNDAQLTVFCHLYDDTRITVRFTIPKIDWSKYSSTAYTGDFAITDGEVTVANMYAVDVSSADLIVSKLPTTVRFYNIVVNNVVWTTATGATAALAGLRYDSALSFDLATATVDVGGALNIVVRIKFLPCILSGIVGFDSAAIGATGDEKTVSVSIDPYGLEATGRYDLPTNLVVNFTRDGVQNTFGNVNYRYDGAPVASRSVYYSYNGFSASEFGVGDNKLRRSYVATLGFGQSIKFVLAAEDRTISSSADYDVGGTIYTVQEYGFYRVNADGTYDKAAATQSSFDIYSIDPFRTKIAGEKGYLPQLIVVTYADGVKELSVTWITRFDVNYLGSDGVFVVQGYINREGMDNQPVAVRVEVQKRAEGSNSVQLSYDGTTAATEVISGIAGSGIYNFAMAYEDAYDLYTDALPAYALVTSGGNTVSVDVDWIVADNTFDVSGGSVVVTGYLVSQGVGHQITMTVAVDTWTFVGIYKPYDTSAEDYHDWAYSYMSPMRFTFISMYTADGYYEVADKAFMVRFAVYNEVSGQTVYKFKHFVPEAYAESGDNVIYFSTDSIARAAAADNKTSTATFYLGTVGKVRLQVTGNITYLVEAPIIETSSLSYYYAATAGYSSYILVDPLNPSLPTTAYSFTNWSTKEKVEWTITDTTSFATVNLNNYLIGGVLTGKSFTLTLKDSYGNTVNDAFGQPVSQSVSVKILFLDRTLMYGTTADGYATVTANFLAGYNAQTYQGRVNPYSNYLSDSSIIASLNMAVNIYGSTRVLRVSWDGETFVSFAAGNNTYTRNIINKSVITSA